MLRLAPAVLLAWAVLIAGSVATCLAQEPTDEAGERQNIERFATNLKRKPRTGRPSITFTETARTGLTGHSGADLWCCLIPVHPSAQNLKTNGVNVTVMAIITRSSGMPTAR